MTQEGKCNFPPVNQLQVALDRQQLDRIIGMSAEMHSTIVAAWREVVERFFTTFEEKFTKAIEKVAFVVQQNLDQAQRVYTKYLRDLRSRIEVPCCNVAALCDRLGSKVATPHTPTGTTEVPSVGDGRGNVPSEGSTAPTGTAPEQFVLFADLSPPVGGDKKESPVPFGPPAPKAPAFEDEERRKLDEQIRKDLDELLSRDRERRQARPAIDPKLLEEIRKQLDETTVGDAAPVPAPSAPSVSDPPDIAAAKEFRKAVDSLVGPSCGLAFVGLPSFAQGNACSKLEDRKTFTRDTLKSDIVGCLLDIANAQGKNKDNRVADVLKKFAKALEEDARDNKDKSAFVRDLLDPIKRMFAALASISGEAIQWILEKFRDTVNAVVKIASEFTGCDLNQFVPIMLIQGLAGLIEKYTGFRVPKLDQTIQYNLDHTCPELIPGQDGTDLAYLSGLISKEIWECWTKANNNIPSSSEIVLNAKRTRLDARQLVAARFRGLIDDQALSQKLRREGVLDPGEATLLEQIERFVPNETDIVRFMLRDAYDDRVAGKYGYDSEFKEKFTDLAKKQFEANGMSESDARLFWRSHWNLPSPGQLFEMLHRLRGGPGSSGVSRTAINPETGQAETREVSNKEIEVDEKTVYDFLGINDMLPFFRERMMAISRPPLTRTDAQRAYMIDAVTREQLYGAYRDLGYSDSNARILVEFTDQLKRRRESKRPGVLSARDLTRFYEQSSLTAEEVRKGLYSIGYGEKEVDSLLLAAETRRKAAMRKKCLASLRKRFLYGEFSDDRLAAELNKLGLSPSQTDSIRSELRCEALVRTKQATAAMLCTWYKQSLIDKNDFVTRLVRIGYSMHDAGKIYESCHIKKEEKPSSGAPRGGVGAERERLQLEKAQIQENNSPVPK